MGIDHDADHDYNHDADHDYNHDDDHDYNHDDDHDYNDDDDDDHHHHDNLPLAQTCSMQRARSELWNLSRIVKIVKLFSASPVVQQSVLPKEERSSHR